VLGFDWTSIKFISSSKSLAEKKEYLSNSLRIVMISSSVIIVLCLIFYKSIAGVLNTENILIFASLVYALFFSFKTLFDSFIKSLYFFRFQAIIKIIEIAAVVFSFILLFFILKRVNYLSYLFSIILGMTILCGLFLWKIKDFIVKFRRSKFSEMFSYSRLSMIFVIVFYITNSIDKIFVGKFLGSESLGLYSAYLVATIIFIGQFSLLFENVFFPTLGILKNKREIVKKIDRIFLFCILPIALIIFIISYLIMLLLGRQYNLNYLFLLFFSLSAAFQFFSTIYRNIAMSNKDAYRLFSRYLLFSPFLLIGLFGFLLLGGLIELKYIIIIYSINSLYYLIVSRLSSNYSTNESTAA
jgi:O-antigen/teichoic acid export membrane protein